MKAKYPALVEGMVKTNNLSADDEKALKDAVADFKKTGAY